MFRTLAIIAGASFLIAIVCFGGAFALAGPDLRNSQFLRDFDWEHFEWNDSDGPENSGPAVTQARELSGFTSVSVGGGIRTEVTAGPEFHVEVISPEPNLIATDLIGSRLSIQPARTHGWWRNHRAALVRVTMPAIDGLDASAGAHVVANGVNAEAIELHASAGAYLEAQGTCRALEAEASSGAHIDAETLVCESGDADVSSGASIDLNVTGQLNVDASDGGRIEAAGDPQMGDISLSSGGSLDRD